MEVHWKIQFFLGGWAQRTYRDTHTRTHTHTHTHTQGRGGLAVKGGELGQFADLRRGCWFKI